MQVNHAHVWDGVQIQFNNFSLVCSGFWKILILELYKIVKENVTSLRAEKKKMLQESHFLGYSVFLETSPVILASMKLSIQQNS